MGEIDDISDRIMNIKAELMFHANNSNIKESKLQLINLIVEKRAQLTKETVNRIHSSKDEPGIYHSSAGAIDYALENPGKNII